MSMVFSYEHKMLEAIAKRQLSLSHILMRTSRLGNVMLDCTDSFMVLRVHNCDLNRVVEIIFKCYKSSLRMLLPEIMLLCFTPISRAWRVLETSWVTRGSP